MDDTTGRMKPRGVEDETALRTREIREEIAQTRVDMSETIEAIQDRLTPSNLVAQAGESVRNATTEKVKQMANSAGQAADRVMDTSFAQTVKANPVPAAMIGIGAAWLLLKGRSEPREFRSAQRDWRVTDRDVAVGTTGYSAYAGGAVNESSRGPQFGNDVRRDYASAGRESVSFDRVVRENPLVVGAAAALVGIAIGMSLPASETENQLMGEARDTIVDRARELASDTADKVQDVAAKAVGETAPPRDAIRPTPDAGVEGRLAEIREDAVGSASGSIGNARSGRVTTRRNTTS